jgi:acylphosphatase
VKAAFHAHGKVQGVGYRWFVVQQAQALGLGGWVRNEPDGTVMGEAEGDLSHLEAFKDLLEGGSPFARVSRLDWWVGEGGQSLPLPFEVRR